MKDKVVIMVYDLYFRRRNYIRGETKNFNREMILM